MLLAATCMGLFWSLNNADYHNVKPQLTFLFIAGTIVVFFILSGDRMAGWATLVYAGMVGAADRIFRDSALYVSDVIDASREAIGVLLAGGNPYVHDFVTTRPVHSPFPYLPGEMLFYGIPWLAVHSIDDWDRIIGIVTIVVLAALAPLVGIARTALCVALYSTFTLAAYGSVEGVNDGGLAFLMVVFAVLLAWSEGLQARGQAAGARACFYASAIFLGWALTYKAFSWPFFPFVALYVWRMHRAEAVRYLATTLGFCAVMVVPFLVWSPGGLLGNIYRGFVFHDFLYGITLWSGMRNIGLPIPNSTAISLIEYAMTLAIFGDLIRQKVISLGGTLMRGLAVLITAFVLDHWATDSYYVFAGIVFVTAIALLELPGPAAQTPGEG